ncbi:pyruvate dehydrogenase [Nocardia sp. 852002-20019_SCH5090214]|uniref:Acetoin:2,6-dichlorophenolindophenol oxidoreductase subunit alpha n=1 Tax=Nocardia cerradoensis TaxID=85688 RepID=A0A231H2Z8_9NOCA|nr:MULTISPECIES: thiamine pyrophosphate-dependent dehydrogenase E1 component subunit alpha [Nocardia]OBA53047.1 pyruvate dehydrogenase [Nocardia sp. 852002-20019_SCH5090214]OXR43178.1 Acetoin:2,6-dichlorophenolindophenol oxidoreductase subunit alpha [Nocardia cerradoensis]
MSPSTPAPSPEAQLDIFATATRIALSDEKYRSYMLSGKIGGMYYSPRGQEFVAASVAAHLRRDDYVVTTYRGLHDQVAKGVPLRDLWAEYLGKAAGTCGGKGGPMHVTAPEYGLMVTTGVVGAGLPIANGLGLSAQMRGTDQVTVVNFGDGASNIGAFHEALNLASVWRLPVVFVCQNNRYAEYTPLREGTSVESIATRAAGYSMPGVTVDGNDPIAMYQVAGDAIGRARRGEGPTLLEAMTFRFHGHVMGDQQGYMPKEELAAAMANDPLPRFRAQLIESGAATVEQIEAVEAAAAAEVADAAEFAFDAPLPDPAELTTDVYAEGAAA